MNSQLHRIGNNLFSRDAVTIEISRESEIDFSKVCRTCLRETQDHDLGNEALFIIRCNGDLARLYEMFEISTGLKISTDDMLPHHICDSCLQSVKSSFSFRCQSQRANQILESLLWSLKENNNSNNVGAEENAFKVEVQEEENEEQIHLAEEVPEKIHEDNQLPQEEISIELANETREPDQDEQNEIINFDEFSLDDGSLNPIDDILQDDEEVMMMDMVIEPLGELSEQNENSQHVVLLKNRNTHFRCDFCDSVFNLQRDLIQHYRDEHPAEKPFKCDVCSVAFVHIQSMRRHRNTHAACPKQKACSICSRLFSRSDDLTRHMRTHTDERPYACSLCQKAFKQHTELKDHMLSHNDRKMYKCEPCKKEWRSRNGWYLHMKAHQDGRSARRKQRVRKFE